jgi:hypothetical protein
VNALALFAARLAVSLLEETVEVLFGLLHVSSEVFNFQFYSHCSFPLVVDVWFPGLLAGFALFGR